VDGDMLARERPMDGLTAHSTQSEKAWDQGLVVQHGQYGGLDMIRRLLEGVSVGVNVDRL